MTNRQEEGDPGDDDGDGGVFDGGAINLED